VTARILANDRQLWLGSTQSGKTTAANYVCSQFACGGAVIDVKGELRMAHAPTVRDVAQLERELRRSRWVRYLPATNEADEFEDVYAALFRLRHRVVRTTEAYAVGSPRGLRLIQTQGAGLGLGHVAESQRPRNIDRTLMTEADHLFLMQKGLSADDLADVSKEFGISARTVIAEIDRLEPYGFLWWDRRARDLCAVAPFPPSYLAIAERFAKKRTV